MKSCRPPWARGMRRITSEPVPVTHIMGNTSIENGLMLHRYWISNCQECPMKAKCTTSKQRRVSRWGHEVLPEAMQSRLDQTPEMMWSRRQTAEQSVAPTNLLTGRTSSLRCGGIRSFWPARFLPIKQQTKIMNGLCGSEFGKNSKGHQPPSD